MKNLFSVLLCNKFNDFISVQQEAENRRETTTTGIKSISSPFFVTADES